MHYSESIAVVSLRVCSRIEKVLSRTVLDGRKLALDLTEVTFVIARPMTFLCARAFRISLSKMLLCTSNYMEQEERKDPPHQTEKSLACFRR